MGRNGWRSDLYLPLPLPLGLLSFRGLFCSWLGQDVGKLNGVLEDVTAGFLEGDSGTHLHGELP